MLVEPKIGAFHGATEGSDVTEDRLFGVRLGRFGLFAICVLSWALGLMGFCISCFLAILALLVYNTAGAHTVDFADSYKYVGLPVGLVVMAASFVTLMNAWMRRTLRKFRDS